jgi:hypothetical protein
MVYPQFDAKDRKRIKEASRLQSAAYLREKEKSFAERRECKEQHGKPIRLSESGVPLVKEKE